MAFVPVPKDLNRVKTKVMFNLTKRQLICFSIAAAVGVPIFFLAKAKSAQQTIPYVEMCPDGICKVEQQPLQSPSPLRTSTISLRRPTTRPPFLRTGATSSTTLTLPFSVQLPFINQGTQAEQEKAHQYPGTGGRFQLYPLRVFRICCKTSLQRATTGLSKQSTSPLPLKARIRRRKAEACPYRNRHPQQL